MTGVFSGTEMFRTTPVTVTYAPPDFRSSGTKYSIVTSGRSGRRAMSFEILRESEIGKFSADTWPALPVGPGRQLHFFRFWGLWAAIHPGYRSIWIRPQTAASGPAGGFFLQIFC